MNMKLVIILVLVAVCCDATKKQAGEPQDGNAVIEGNNNSIEKQNGSGEGSDGGQNGSGEGPDGGPNGSGKGPDGGQNGSGEGPDGGPNGSGEGPDGGQNGSGEGLDGGQNGSGEGSDGGQDGNEESVRGGFPPVPQTFRLISPEGAFKSLPGIPKTPEGAKSPNSA